MQVGSGRSEDKILSLETTPLCFMENVLVVINGTGLKDK